MNDPQPAWWNLLPMLSGLVMGFLGALGTVFLWLHNRFTKNEERIVAIEASCRERNAIATANIARLEAYHQSNTHRLDAIEETTQRISDKQDRLMDVLINRGKEGRNGRG